MAVGNYKAPRHVCGKAFTSYGKLTEAPIFVQYVLSEINVTKHYQH